MTKDYYAMLGLTENAEEVVVRAIFRLMAHRYHPDKWQSDKDHATRMMSAINDAYRNLCKCDTKEIRPTDYYQCLGLLPNADAQMIQVAYDALMHKYRMNPTKLNLLQNAYQTLSDAGRRRRYDIQVKSEIGNYSSDFKIWKLYLIYNLGFYVVMGIIAALLLL